MNSHINHTLSHLDRYLSYEFQFTGFNSKFTWNAGDDYVTERCSNYPTKVIDISDIRQNGTVENTLKKVIKKVCKTKTEEEEQNGSD